MILHLVLKSDWDKSPLTQHYIPESLAKEGFIHCTATATGLLTVANTFYKSIQGDFFALEIDEHKLNALLKWEAPAHPAPLPPAPPDKLNTTLPPAVVNELGESSNSRRTVIELPTQFPHIYGPLNRNAITGIRPVLRAADGSFVEYGNPINLSPPPLQASQPATKPQPPTPQASQPAPPTEPAKTADPRTPIVKAADELVDATDQFSEELKRLRSRVEAKMSLLDEEIAKL